MIITVVLTAPTADELLAEHRHYVGEGAELVEWRLDHLRGPFDLREMLAARPGPTIVTLRLPADGGAWIGDESQRLKLLREVIAAGVEYVDLEAETAAQIPRQGSTKRIVSYHNFDETPANLKAIHDRLASQDADVVKLATMARSMRDTFRMMSLAKESRVPTLALCMGELGTPSRLLAGKVGSPFTYAAPDGRDAPAPGQVSFRAMRDLYRSTRMTKDTQVYGVIGDPIAHSRSPLIYNAAFESLRMDATYVPFRVPPSEIEIFFDDARDFGIRGLSVTIPHKEAAFRTMTRGEDAVGAVNTLVFDGKETVGYNTDGSAAIESILAAMGPKATLSERTALVLGAGGAAKAIVYELVQGGARVIIASRTRARAEELATLWNCATIDWDARHDTSADILVNCTPLGMQPRTEETPFDVRSLKASMVVFDTVYTPVRTRLICEAEHVGATVVTGIEMFLRQAARQFLLLTGREPPLDVMRKVLT